MPSRFLHIKEWDIDLARVLAVGDVRAIGGEHGTTIAFSFSIHFESALQPFNLTWTGIPGELPLAQQACENARHKLRNAWHGMHSRQSD